MRPKRALRPLHGLFKNGYGLLLPLGINNSTCSGSVQKVGGSGRHLGVQTLKWAGSRHCKNRYSLLWLPGEV